MLGSLLWAFLHSGILTSAADLLEEMTLVLHLQLFVYFFGCVGYLAVARGIFVAARGIFGRSAQTL